MRQNIGSGQIRGILKRIIFLLEEVNKFIYLDVNIFSRKLSLKFEIQSRIVAGNRCIADINKLRRKTYISRKLNVKAFTTVMRPI